MRDRTRCRALSRPDPPAHRPVGVGDVRRHPPLLRPPDPLPSGDADGFVEYVARAAIVSSEAAQDSARALAELPVYWRDIARPRSNSADEKIIDALTPRSVSAPSSTCNGSELGELGVDVDLDGTEDLEHVG